MCISVCVCTVRGTVLLLFVVVVAAALGNSLDFHFVSDVDTVGYNVMAISRRRPVLSRFI